MYNLYYRNKSSSNKNFNFFIELVFADKFATHTNLSTNGQGLTAKVPYAHYCATNIEKN